MLAEKELIKDPTSVHDRPPYCKRTRADIEPHQHFGELACGNIFYDLIGV